MKRLEVSGAVRPLLGSLGVRGLMNEMPLKKCNDVYKCIQLPVCTVLITAECIAVEFHATSGLNSQVVSD